MRNQNIIVKNLTLAETIAHRNPEVANELLIKAGYPASRNREELAHRLSVFLLKNQDKGLKALADIHPDRELLFSNFEGDSNVDRFDNADGDNDSHADGNRRTMKRGTKDNMKHFNCCGHADGEFSNCAGCGGSCGMKQNGQRHFNADGSGSTKQAPIPTQSLFNKDMLAIVGIIALTGIVLIAFNKSAK